jgi:predicted dehydrogenase
MMTANPISVGIIGVHPEKGWAAQAHLPALAQLPDYKVAAISHHDGDVARAAAEMFGVERAFSSADEMVADPNVELVVVAVKVTRHKELVTKALEAGKAVFCEWPLGVDLNEAEELRDLASARGLKTAIGLQARSAPTFAYVRDLVADGYLGDVTSVSLIGSGIVWGDSMPESFAYTLDPAAGASMLHVPFAHSIDAMLHAVGAKMQTVSGRLANRRSTTRIQETNAIVPMKAADQVVVNGTLSNGAIVSAHFRGGISRATNFHLEFNGSKGDLVVTSPVGYIGLGGFTLKGAQNDETLDDLKVPDSYGGSDLDDGVHHSVAAGYARLAADLRTGTSSSPTFEDAVDLHRLIDAIELSNGRAIDV